MPKTLYISTTVQWARWQASKFPGIRHQFLKITCEKYYLSGYLRSFRHPNTAQWSPLPMCIWRYRHVRENLHEFTALTTGQRPRQCTLFEPQPFAKSIYSIGLISSGILPGIRTQWALRDTLTHLLRILWSRKKNWNNDQVIKTARIYCCHMLWSLHDI